MLNHFTYLLETPYWLLQNSTVGDKYPFAKKYELVNEINQIGTRYSGKTISNIKMFGELLKISLLIKEPICIIASMYWSKDLKDSVFQNIWNMLDENNISYTINLSNFTFTLSNGSKIYCKGLHSPSRKEKLKAFADLNKYKLVIDWREECDQFQQKDLSDLEFAIRGYQNKITISHMAVGFGCVVGCWEFSMWWRQCGKHRQWYIGKAEWVVVHSGWVKLWILGELWTVKIRAVRYWKSKSLELRIAW
ncbi:phage terminase large subunit [Spiroplasma poulsonii]|uniref:phage terminase large subunit n=1 Tax=Spiroplasma poulsonii TaxID=2138 RepID=UPI001F4C67E3|nr:phage terminase large subunit [Spiroplasma poulsonii]UNF62121.1 phage terminase large subunit [Spiroplasma poulsonii]